METLNLLTNIISSIALVISLFYVGYQVKLKISSEKKDIFREYTDGAKDFALTISQNETLSKCLIKINRYNFLKKDFTENENAQISFCFLSMLYSFSSVYKSYTLKKLTEEELLILLTTRLLESNYAKEIWTNLKHAIYYRDFTVYLEKLYKLNQNIEMEKDLIE
jgi:hypothetical protein